MHRLLFLLGALVLAFLAQRWLTNADELAPYLLRDSLLLSAVAILLFAYHALPLARPRIPLRPPTAYKPFAILLTITGLLCALVGGMLVAIQTPLFALATLRQTLWLLGLVAFLAGAFWPQVTQGWKTLTHRWTRTESGEFIRVPIEEMEATPAPPPDPTPEIGADFLSAARARWLLIALVGVALLLRMWDLYALPTRCVADECARLLQWAGAQNSAAWYEMTPLSWLVRWALGGTEPDIRTIRLVGVLIGTLTVPLWYGFARQFVRPSGALAAAALLAANPWHIRASATTDPNLALPLLISLGGWLLLYAYASGALRWSAVAGVAWGLLLAQAISYRPVLLLWLLLASILGVFAVRATTVSQRITHAALWILGALATAAPWLVGGAAPDIGDGWQWTLFDMARTLLWRADPSALLAVDGGLLGLLPGALCLLGLGVLVRFIRRPAALYVLMGGVLCTVAVLRDTTELISSLLLLLPLFFIAVAIALDQIVTAFQAAWRPVVPPARVAVAISALLLVLALPATIRSMGTTGALTTASADGVGAAMGRFLATDLQNAPGTQSLYILPPALINDVALRAEAGRAFQEAVDAGRVRPFDPVRDLYFVDSQTGGDTTAFVYLMPVREQELLQLFSQLYPTVPTETIYAEGSEMSETGEPLFTVARVSQQDLAAVRGLRRVIFTNDPNGTAATPGAESANAGLRLEEDPSTAASAPDLAIWEGLLLAPEAGNYRLILELLPGGDDASMPQISFYLDDQLMLNNTIGALERQVTLAQGAYPIRVRYEGGTEPTGFHIRWQPPRGALEEIPLERLRNTSVINRGLVGTYYAGEQVGGPALAVRRDPLVGMPADLPQPYSVRWSGLFAAGRAGEYLFGAASTGRFRIAVNGTPVATKEATPDDEMGLGYVEGLIYLPSGWHTIQVEYAPHPGSEGPASDEMQIFWQPPGSHPDRLPNRYLAPADVASAPPIMQPPPALTDPRLGDDQFALTIAPEFRNPQTLLPPGNLPPLGAEQLWQQGSCGPGPAQLNGPRGVALDPGERRVYVADAGNQRVAVYEWDGAAASPIEHGEFEEPFDLAFAPPEDGENPSLLVLDATAQQIWRVPTGGSGEVTALPMGTSFYRPRGFAVDPSGVIAVADTGGARVVLLTPSGDVMTEFGGVETALGQGQPVDALFANGRLWAITAENGRLWRLDSSLPGGNGSMLAVQPANTFDAPHFAALGDGSFFLTDPARRGLLYYTPDGQPVGQWPTNDSFLSPVGMDAVQFDGTIYLGIADSAACSISLWRVELPS